jgi:membrane-bound lytic murein transglycosylase B
MSINTLRSSTWRVAALWGLAAALALGASGEIPADNPSAGTRVPSREPPALNAEVQSFIGDMAAQHGFDRSALLGLFQTVQVRQDILDAMAKPAETKPWYQYRPIFVNSSRIQGGARFWEANAEVLQRAEARYGVPAEIIVAIIGVETRYGQNTGRYPVLDALTTLAFYYPPRSQYFRSELEQFLLLAREEGLDPKLPKGSYAGAMGICQFMPSSFRSYAVDFDRDGRRDLWNSTPDAIGSIAHYLGEHGWLRGAPIAAPLSVLGSPRALPVDATDLRPKVTLRALRALGASAQAAVSEETPVAVVALEEETGPEYWVGFQNFYVITRYNRSPLYAMAVTQLSAAIRDERAQLRGL